MSRSIFLCLATIMLSACSTSAGREKVQPVAFVYDDLRRFGAAMQAIDGGANPEDTVKLYFEAGSPALREFARRYSVTPELLLSEIKQRPKYYRSLAAHEPFLKSQQRRIRRYVAKLSAIAGGAKPVPIFYIVGSMRGGGSPVVRGTPEAPDPAIAIPLEIMGMTPAVDLSEFPDGPRSNVTDVAQVAVHEMAHVYQLGVQGLVPYRSIYGDGPNSSNMAVMVREGCAEYLTYLASGLLRERHLYARERQAELWALFQSVSGGKAFSAPGWFSGKLLQHPNGPTMLGYGLGLWMCEHYHRTAADPEAALRDILSANSPEQVRKFADSYSRKFAR